MSLTRFTDSAVNVPVVLQRLLPTVHTVQKTAKIPALSSSTLPGHWWCLKQLFTDLGELLVLTPLSSLQPLSKGRAVQRTLKLKTPLEPQTKSFTA